MPTAGSRSSGGPPTDTTDRPDRRRARARRAVGGSALAPLPSPDGSRFVHIEVHDGLIDLVVGELGERRAAEARPRPAAEDAADRRGGLDRAPVNPWDGVWRAFGWLSDGAGSPRSARARRARRTCGCCPSRASRPDGADRARSPTRCPASSAPRCRPAASRRRAGHPDRARRPPRRGHAVAAAAATGKRGGGACPDDPLPARRPDLAGLSRLPPFKLLLVDEGFAFLDVDFRGSTGYGRAFRQANHGEWGHADVHDLIDAARWAASSPGPTAGSRSSAGRTAATWSSARWSRSRRCGRPGSTCTATRRSPRATATATDPAAWTCTR